MNNNDITRAAGAADSAVPAETGSSASRGGSGEAFGSAKKRRLFMAAAIALIAVLAVTAGGVLAYYLSKSSGYELVKAQEFYFAGDMLSESQPSYYVNAGTTGIDITLRNHPDQLRYSQSDISYTVTVTEKGSGNEVFTKSGTLGSSELSDSTVSITGLESGKSYIVTATGTAGYSKTISAEISVLSGTGSVYKHLDTSDSACVVLTVWADYTCGEVAVSFPAGLIPDASDPVLAGVSNYSAGSYAAGSFTDTFSGGYYSKTYRFFRDGSVSNVNVDSFGVTVGGVAAQAAELPQ